MNIDNTSEIILPNGEQAAKVIGPDGSVIWQKEADIPDSVDNHYKITSEDESTVTDHISSRHLDVHGASLTADSGSKEGYHMDYGGGSDRLRTTDISDLQNINELSIALWIEIDSDDVSEGDRIFHQVDGDSRGSDTTDFVADMRPDNDGLRFAAGDSEGDYPHIDDIGLFDVGWVHLTFRWSSTSEQDRKVVTVNGNDHVYDDDAEDSQIGDDGEALAFAAAEDGTDAGDQNQDDIMIGVNRFWSDGDVEQIYNSHPRS